MRLASRSGGERKVGSAGYLERMTTQTTIAVPKLEVSTTGARNVFETDTFENGDGSLWISPDSSWGAGDVGFVDDVLRLSVGRDLFGPDAKVSYVWCGRDSDASEVDSVLLSIAIPGVAGVHLTSSDPLLTTAVTPGDAESATDCAVGIYEAVAIHLGEVLGRLTAEV